MRIKTILPGTLRTVAVSLCVFALCAAAMAAAEAQPCFKGSVQVKDLQFTYEAIGSGVPLVMIHGFGVERETMRGCMKPLFKDKTGWKRIYFDLPGMGATPGPKWIRTSDQILAAVREFIRLAIPGEKFALVGESYGGYLCRGIVRQDAGVGYRDQYQFLEQYPRASFVVLDRCGHILQIEQAGLFNVLVNEWLERLSEPAPGR